jgi:hypothetical protein
MCAIWGATFGAFWWVVPLMGMLLCATLLFLTFRFLATGRGLACGRAAAGDEPADLRAEVRALREEITRLRTAP